MQMDRPIQSRQMPVQAVVLRLFPGAAGWLQTSDRLLHSRDGGKSWVDVTPKVSTLERLRPVDGDQAWLSNGQELIRTRDGGRTWLSAGAPFSHGAIAFASESRGWAMVSAGVAAGSMPVTIYRTEDGGASWTKLEGGLPNGGLKDGITFLSHKVGWITGITYAPGHTYLYLTKDGGGSWAPQELPVPTGYKEANLLVQSPILLGPAEVVLPMRIQGAGDQTVFFRSTDAGQSWKSGPALPGMGAYAFAGLTHGWYWDGKALQATTDAGATWSTVPTTLQTVTALAFSDPKTGLAVADGALLRTEDGGQTWIPVQLP